MAAWATFLYISGVLVFPKKLEVSHFSFCLSMFEFLDMRQRSSYYVCLGVDVSLPQLCITGNAKITRVTCRDGQYFK